MIISAKDLRSQIENGQHACGGERVMLPRETVMSLLDTADRLFSALDEALTLADVPERDQDDAWYARREALGKICDEYVGFVAAKGEDQ